MRLMISRLMTVRIAQSVGFAIYQRSRIDDFFCSTKCLRSRARELLALITFIVRIVWRAGDNRGRGLGVQEDVVARSAKRDVFSAVSTL